METNPLGQEHSSTPPKVGVTTQRKQRQLIFVLIFALLAVILLILVLANTMQRVKPQKATPTRVSKEPTVNLKKEYQNPFDKNSQYVNPFSQYKNPFDNLK